MLQQQTLNIIPYMKIYDIVVPKDNLLRKINELIDFSFIYEEFVDKYCLDNGRNAISPIRIFKYLLLKSIFDLSDDLVHLQTSNDIDAKVGHKSADTLFFGYKTHIAMTEERIITAATITSGENNHGKELKTLL